MVERIGIIGLGRMGWALAARLATQSVEVRGWTRSGVDAARAKADGFQATGSLEDLVATSDVLILSLFDDAAVREVLASLAALDLGSRLVVETSTVSPDIVREMVGGIEAAQGRLLDAPISGGPNMVAAGTIGIFIGGRDADVERFAPVGALLSAKCVHVGPLGAGASAKIVNNMALDGMWEVLSEAMETGARLGLPFETMLGFLETSPAAAPAFVTRLPMIRGDIEAVGFSVTGILKDLAVIRRAASSVGANVPAMDAAADRYAQMIDSGRGAEDLSKVLPHSYAKAVADDGSGQEG